MRRFPALYRMPVVYLTAAVVAAALALTGSTPSRRFFGGSTGSSIRLAVDESKAEHPPMGPEAPRASLAPRSDAVLRGRDGLRRKVLLTGRHVIARKTPDGEPSGEDLATYSIRFIFAETPTMFQVGTGRTGSDGWVFREELVEWGSRLMAVPTHRSSRPIIEIFGEQTCLAAALNGRTCPIHDGRCPSEVENGPESKPSIRVGWPILNFGTIVGSDGAPRAVEEVVLFASEAVPTDAERLAPLRPALRHVYVAFVLDTTASMKPAIDAARKLAKDLTTAVARQFGDVTLHLGLIEFRDSAAGLGFKARVATPFTDAAGFRAVMNSLEPALREDLTPGESVFEGVNLSLPGTPGGLDWPTGRSGELATKLLVLLGDSPDHAQDLDRATALAARARAAGISIATVRLDRPGSLALDDRSRLEAQWRTLAEGAYRPREGASQFSGPLPPLSIRAEGAASLAPRLQSLVEDRVEQAKGLAELAAVEDEGRLDDYLQSRGITRTQAAPVLDDLRRGDPAPKRTHRRTPLLRSGWLAERIGDTQFVTTGVLLSREEVDALIRRLSQMPRDPGELRAIVNAAVAGELDSLATGLPSLSVADQLRRSFPASRADRRDVETRLRSALEGLTRWRGSISWSDPRATIDGRATVPFDLFDF